MQHPLVPHHLLLGTRELEKMIANSTANASFQSFVVPVLPSRTGRVSFVDEKEDRMLEEHSARQMGMRAV